MDGTTLALVYADGRIRDDDYATIRGNTFTLLRGDEQAGRHYTFRKVSDDSEAGGYNCRLL